MIILRLLLLAWRAYAAVAFTSWPPSQRASHECTFEGYYAVPGATTTQPCPGTKPCPPGSYCTYGQRYKRLSFLNTKMCYSLLVVESNDLVLLECLEPRKLCVRKSARPPVLKAITVEKAPLDQRNVVVLMSTALWAPRIHLRYLKASMHSAERHLHGVASTRANRDPSVPLERRTNVLQARTERRPAFRRLCAQDGVQLATIARERPFNRFRAVLGCMAIDQV